MSQRSWKKWSDKASLNRNSQEESLMHLQCCGRERRVESWDFAWTWKCISMARSWMRTTQYQTWRRSSTTNMGPHTLPKLTSQMPTIKLNLTKKQIIYAQSTHLRDCSRCADYLRDWKTLPQSSSIALNQHSKESKVLWSFKTIYWCMEIPKSSSTRECLQSRVDYVTKILLLMKKSNSKPVDGVSFLGYPISKEGIAPDPKYVEKLKNAKAPTNNKQLKSFAGLANIYGRMISDFATKMLPLNNMRNSHISWGKMQQKAFEDIKNELCANPLVQPYSLQKEATVTTDASEKAIGGVLLHEWHPVIYVSRKLTPAEQNYSNIEPEEQAIVFVVKSLKQFLHGVQFTLQTDHEPLKYLFAPEEEIPKTASVRITRWAITLMGFDYELKYSSGEQMPQADASSRMDFDEDESDNDRVCFAINNIYFNQSDLVTQAEIKTELGTNRLFHDIMKRIKSGNWKQCSEAEKGFEQQKDALTLHNGIIFRGVVPFIPPKQRNLVLTKGHETNPGKNATEASVRMIACSPGNTQDVQHFVSKCKMNRPSLGKTVSTWPEADVWQRLHMYWGYVKD